MKNYELMSLLAAAKGGKEITVCDTVQDAAYIINAIQLFEMQEMRDEK